MASKRKATTEAAPPAENGTGRNKPVHEVRLGRVKVAVWKNDTKEGGIRFAFTVSRSCKDQQGQWKSTSSFDPQNTFQVMECFRLATLWVMQEGYALHGTTKQGPEQQQDGGEPPAEGASDIPF